MLRGNSRRRALNSRPRTVRRRGPNRPPRRLRPDPRVEAAAAIEPALGIRVVEVVDDARHLHALVFVQLVLEDAEGTRRVVEHQVLADHAARIRQPVRELRVRRHQQQPRRFGAVRPHDQRTRPLESFAPPPIEVGNAGRAARSIGLDARDVAVGPHFAAAGGFRLRHDGRQRGRLRHHLAAEAVTEAAVNARRAAAIWLRIDRHRRRDGWRPSFRAPRSRITPDDSPAAAASDRAWSAADRGAAPASPERRPPIRPSCNTARDRHR